MKKKLTKEELSSIRAKAASMRKTFGGGRPKGPEKSKQAELGEWSHSVLARQAKARKLTLKAFVTKVAVLLANKEGWVIPECHKHYLSEPW